MHLSTRITVPDGDALPALATNRQSFRRSLLTAVQGLIESWDKAGSRISDDKYNGSWHIRLRVNSPKTRLLTFFPAVCFILTGDGDRIYTTPPEKSSRSVLNILVLPPSISSCGAGTWIIQHTTDTLQTHALTINFVPGTPIPTFFSPPFALASLSRQPSVLFCGVVGKLQREMGTLEPEKCSSWQQYRVTAVSTAPAEVMKST